jgi:hypothetical protein
VTANENYKQIVENIFGENSCKVDTKSTSENLVTGALNSTNFSNFNSSFITRLKRLHDIYSTHENLKDLLDTIQQVADMKNWEGAYAELVSYDTFHSDTNFISNPLSLEITLPASQTLAAKFNKTNTNYDGAFDDFDIYFDVKVLSDKIKDILNGIISEAKKSTGNNHIQIQPGYPLDLNFEEFQTNRGKLLKELKDLLNQSPSISLFSSQVITNLKYTIQWTGKGILMTSDTYNPYLNAQNNHTLLFKHAKKFSIIQPSLIVFVLFPWFSEKTITVDFDNSRETYLRSFSRRFFMQYRYDTRTAKDIFKSYIGNDSLFFITKQLSGIIFLVDNSITSTDRTSKNIERYIYLNPNADHPIGNGLFIAYLRELGFAIDTFQYDNY